jgi:hypothetical protein
MGDKRRERSLPSFFTIAIGAALGAVGVSLIRQTLLDTLHPRRVSLQKPPRNPPQDTAKPNPPSTGGNTDVAALCAAITAVAITMFSVRGAFQLLGAAVALTLAFVVFGHVWKHHRSIMRTIAIAMILGVIAVPIVGFALELANANDPIKLLEKGDPGCLDAARKLQTCEDTALKYYWLVIVWAGATVVAIGADLVNQRKLRSTLMI